MSYQILLKTSETKDYMSIIESNLKLVNKILDRGLFSKAFLSYLFHCSHIIRKIRQIHKNWLFFKNRLISFRKSAKISDVERKFNRCLERMSMLLKLFFWYTISNSPHIRDHMSPRLNYKLLGIHITGRDIGARSSPPFDGSSLYRWFK